jgi:hypothetical protein
MSKMREPTIRENYLAECLALQARAIRDKSAEILHDYPSVEDTLPIAATVLAGRLANGEDV